jgi:hypothetical protein
MSARRLPPTSAATRLPVHLEGALSRRANALSG